MTAVARVKLHKRGIADTYARSRNLAGLFQLVNTVLPLAALWAVVAQLGMSRPIVTLLITAIMSLFLLRLFALMHDCGHGSLFRSRGLNQIVGFLFGVVAGMPQYVWARHHNFHHTTNGHWGRYRGPLAILSVDEYDDLNGRQRRRYERMRHPAMAPLGGFVYLILNPRLTWLNGTAALFRHLVREKWRQPAVPLRSHVASFRSRYWETPAEYRHMTFNNLGVLMACSLMSWWMGPALFFPVYLAATSIAGAMAIVLFTVQHNFEHSYAGNDDDWDYDAAAIHGTSYLRLPGWLNWFSADIGYHHVHHLCARIPNYSLAACHVRHAHLFPEVRRLTLGDIRKSLTFLLWDPAAGRIISIAEHDAAGVAAI